MRFFYSFIDNFWVEIKFINDYYDLINFFKDEFFVDSILLKWYDYIRRLSSSVVRAGDS